jgi:hypothetical protein
MPHTLKDFQREDPTQYHQRLRDLSEIIDIIIGTDPENPKIDPLTLIAELSTDAIMVMAPLTRSPEAQQLYEEALLIFPDKQMHPNEVRLAIIYLLSTRGQRG